MKRYIQRHYFIFVITSMIIMLSAGRYSFAAQKKPALPPALVETEPVREVVVKPNALYTGTVHFKDISEIASEVEGKVEKVLFDEGFRVKKGEPLVILNSDLLLKEIASAKSRWEAARVDLEKARKDFARIDRLYKKDGASEQLHDEFFYKTRSLEKKIAGLRALYEKLLVELRKKTIRSPFDAVVIGKMVQVGEWVSRGTVCARLGRIASTEVIVHVPSKYIKYNRVGESLALYIPAISSSPITGKIYAIVPRGDVSSRTFPVKIKIDNNNARYLDGMEAKVYIFTGKPGKYLAVSRDALVSMQGANFIYTVNRGVARMVPVIIEAYMVNDVAVKAPGLKAGVQVVIRGNERLRPGQPVKSISATSHP